MALKLFNTLTKKKEEFKEIEKGKVKMYTCGPTVYDFAHIGNFRAYICADILKRYLEYKGYHVKHIMNITDVDDKTIKNSQKEKISLKDFTERYTKAFFEDLETLNIEKAHFYPRATDHINEMVLLIKSLMDKGIAYRGDDNSIYFDVSKFKRYGKLSGVKVNELMAGARVSQDEYEKDKAQDFALWKAWDEKDGDVFWETEIGKGRPGWHIECSAMSSKHLGNHFDIHTGGIDLVFPHHENEIAQSEGASDHHFVNYWVHNEWLLVNGKKMSKSLGNFFTLRDLLTKGFSAKAIRYLLLSAHYKVQFNFTEDGLSAAENTIKRLKELVLRLKDAKDDKENPIIDEHIKRAINYFESNMDDDLNISLALTAIFEFVKEINKMDIGKKDAEKVLDSIRKFDSVLGVLEWKDEEVPREVMDLVEERLSARKNKDYKASDQIREKIKSLGYLVDDTSSGARVKKI